MHTANRLLAAAVTAALALNSASSRAADQTSAQAATWQQHHEILTFRAYTSEYTCDGIRSKVREILLYLGARRDDLKIVVSGCGPSEFPTGGLAPINVEFSTLAVTSDASQASVVPGHWTQTKILPRSPNFIDAGDCELIAQMRQLLSTDFAWQNLDYKALCTPHDVSVNSFELQGLVLKMSRGAS